MVEILSWINNGRDFKKGVELYKKFGANATLKKLFDNGESPFLVEKLNDELEKLLKATSPKVAPSELQKNTDAKPELYHFKVKRKGEIYAAMNNLHTKLKMAKSTSTRYKQAKALLELEDELAKIWQELDYFDANGHFIINSAIKQISALELSKRLDLLTNYINRNKAQNKTHLVVKYLEEKTALENIAKNIKLEL